MEKVKDLHKSLYLVNKERIKINYLIKLFIIIIKLHFNCHAKGSFCGLKFVCCIMMIRDNK